MDKAIEASSSASEFIKSYAGYKSLSADEKLIVDSVFSDTNTLFSVEQLFQALRSNGYVVTRHLEDESGLAQEPLNEGLKNLTKEDLHEDYINDRKSGGRKKIKIVGENSIGDTHKTTSIKKISNIVNGLLHQASTLVNNKFAGSNYADNNTIIELYEKIANNMYLITSYNPKNVQLQKLDTEFEKLFKLVYQGIRSFQPPKSSMSGGSVAIPNNLFVPQKRYHTSFPHLL